MARNSAKLGRRPAKNYVALLLGGCFGILLVWTLTAPDAVSRIEDHVARCVIYSQRLAGPLMLLC